jgi:hypothetical protein
VRLASFLILFAAAAALPVVPVGATGFYCDPHSFFRAIPPSDSTRALVVIRQSECDLGRQSGSLLTGDVLLRPRSRIEVRIGLQFPAVRDTAGVRYGFGDLMLHANARVAGDSAGAARLFVRADARIPTGSASLRPFSDATLEGEGGIEARLAARGLDVSAAALYTIVPDVRDEGGFVNDAHFTLAASIGARLPGSISIDCSAFFIGFENGDERTEYALSIGCALSKQLLLEIGGAAETGEASSRAFDSSVSVALAYRVPPSRSAPRADSTNP